MLNSFGFNPLGASPLGPHRSSLRLSIHFQGCAVPVETLLQCATCHSQFVRGSPLVPMQRTSMTGTTFSKFWYPRFRCGPNLVCDGERSLGEWGFLFERGSWVFIIGVVIAAGVVQCLAVVRRAVPVLLEFVFWPLLNHGNALIPPGIEGWQWWTVVGARSAPFPRYVRHSLVPAQMRSTELPATTEGEWRRRHSL